MKKLLAIIGARPQFIKHAPLDLSLRKYFEVLTLHTGQHFDKKMSEVFFSDLGMNEPKYILKAGGGNHGEMTGKMMIDLEPIFIKESPDIVLVYGDTNSTLAGALVAAKLNLPIVHVEAGLRSFNRNMPEEINRILTDQLSSVLLAPTDSAVKHLANEGILNGVYKTGDVMLDTLKMVSNKLTSSEIKENYILMTLHRPYNVDNFERLRFILKEVSKLKIPVIFPVHPRTKKSIDQNREKFSFPMIKYIDPVGYIDNISFLNNSIGLITDSGGMQKEAYFLKKKCITIRSETEWVETLEGGWNTLLYSETELNSLPEKWNENSKGYKPNLYGNGHAADEIAGILKNLFK